MSARIGSVSLPHAGAMRLLRAELQREGDAVLCRASLREGGPFMRDGRAPASLCVELVAQAAAAALAAEGEPRRGHLLAVRALSLFADSLGVDDSLEVSVHVSSSSDLATARGEVRLDGEVIASATLTVRLEPL